MFGWGRAGRRNRDPRLAELIRPSYTAALRLTGDPASAEELIVRAYRRLDGAARRETGGAALELALFAALYAAQREVAGPLIGLRDIQWASSGHLIGPARRRGSPEQILATAFDGLPAALWHPLWLRDNRGFRYGEIALVLDVTPSVVLTLVSRGRRHLAAALRVGAPAGARPVAARSARRTIESASR